MASVFSAFPIPQRPEYSGNLGSADSDGNEVPVPRRPPSPSHGVFFVLVFFYFLFLVRTDWLVYLGWRSREPKRGTHVYYQTGTDCLPACVICLSGCRWLSGETGEKKKIDGPGGLRAESIRDPGVFRPDGTKSNRKVIISFVLFWGGAPFLECPFPSHSTAGRSVTRPAWAGCFGVVQISISSRSIYLRVLSLPGLHTGWCLCACVSVCVCLWHMSCNCPLYFGDYNV